MSLDLSSLERALSSLERAILRSRTVPADLEVRDAVIQRFEYTYDLCWKMLRRQLEAEAASLEAIDALSFPDLVREGGERGLIDDVGAWLEFRHSRNITSHTYDEKKAASVRAVAEQFAPVARQLLEKLQSRNP